MVNEVRPLKTIVRMTRIVEILERERALGPSAVAEEVGISRATAYDYLHSLNETGYVVNNDGKYSLSYRFLGIGGRLKYRSRFFHAAKVPLKKLASETRELSFIGVREGGEWVMLHDESDLSSVTFGTYPGLRFPLHSHASGKVILAYLPWDEARELIEIHGLSPFTENTVTDIPELKNEIEIVSDQGYAVAHGEQVIGVSSLSKPIVIDEDLIGTISVVCPTGRMQNNEYREKLGKQLSECVDETTINYRFH